MCRTIIDSDIWLFEEAWGQKSKETASNSYIFGFSILENFMQISLQYNDLIYDTASPPCLNHESHPYSKFLIFRCSILLDPEMYRISELKINITQYNEVGFDVFNKGFGDSFFKILSFAFSDFCNLAHTVRQFLFRY